MDTLTNYFHFTFEMDLYFFHCGRFQSEKSKTFSYKFITTILSLNHDLNIKYALKKCLIVSKVVATRKEFTLNTTHAFAQND